MRKVVSKYQKIYDAIIERGKERNWKSNRWRFGEVEVEFYTEVHHILPKSLKGSDDLDNLVFLSAKEHFICHYLLTKIFPESEELIRAFMIMCNRTEGKNANNYQKQKEFFIQSLKNREVSEETRLKMSKASIEKGKCPTYRKKLSVGVRNAYENKGLREKISKASTEVWKRPGFKEKMSKKAKSLWTEDKKRLRAEEVREQNRNDKNLKKKRLDAIKNHQYNKSDEWVAKISIINKERANTKEFKERASKAYYKSKFNNSRKVINLETKEIYPSIKKAAESVGMNYNTVKKYLYNGKDFKLKFFKEE